MELNVRTVFGAFLQSGQLPQLPFVMKPYTTLNEKFNIQSGVVPTSEQIPAMRYMCIGNGGHQLVVGGDGMGVPKPLQHRPTDAALFNHLPFILRTQSNDLTPTERANYALRKTETHDNVVYIAYYLKRLSLDAVTVDMEYNAVADNVTTTTALVCNASNLSPIAPAINNSGSNTVSGDYVSASAKLQFNFTADDVNELLNVSNIIYGDQDHAIISEMGLVSGIDKTVQASSINNGTFNYAEVIAAQIVTHYSTFHSMQFTRTGLQMNLDIGATEPMFLPA